MKRVVQQGISGVIALVLVMAALVWTGGGTVEASSRSAVYTATNAANGNKVIAFKRNADGTLGKGKSFSTHGRGTGSGLGSQGSLILNENDRWLFVVNAGSNDVSVFKVESDGDLDFASKAASGGAQPISLTIHDDMLYVLNAGSSAITGFHVSKEGKLSPLAGSTQPLSGTNVGPAQVQFSPNGKLLVVTEKATNKIDVFTVDHDGVASAPVVHDSAGTTPFGFAFGKHNTLVVSEAFSGATDASAASSYSLQSKGNLHTVSASVPTHQTAACWVVVTDNGRYAYASNAGSASVSGYRINSDGKLTLLDADGRTGVTANGGNPIDAALSNNSHYLYVLSGSNHTISAFKVKDDGSLSLVDSATSLPAGSVGLAAR